MVLNEQQKTVLLESFQAIHENKIAAKALNASNTEMMKSLAESFQIPKCDIADAYKYFIKTVEGKVGDIEVVSALFESVVPDSE